MAFRVMTTPLVYILHSGNLFGTERMALATIAGLDEYHQKYVVAPQGYGPGSVLAAARLRGTGTLAFRNLRQLATRLLSLFARHRSVDVIATGVSQSLICMLLAAAFRVKLRHLHVVHGGTNELDSYGRKYYLARLPVKLIAVSSFVKTRLIANGLKPERVTVIQNFLSSEETARRPRRPSFVPGPAGYRELDPTAVRVVLVSRIDPNKRIDLLVDALERHDLTAFRFDVYGGGADLEHHRQRCAGQPNIRFHGFVDDVAARMAEADFFLHLCPDEPFGLVVLEAFVARLPVLVPDRGGTAELVDDGVNGHTYAASDPRELASALQRLAALPADRLDALTAAGCEAIERRFSDRAAIEQYRRAFASMG